MTRAFLATLILVAACDAPAEVLDTARVSLAAPSKQLDCSEPLREIVHARAEQLACLAECDTLMLACLDEPSPECFACEHERAICVSACPMGPLAP